MENFCLLQPNKCNTFAILQKIVITVIAQLVEIVYGIVRFAEKGCTYEPSKPECNLLQSSLNFVFLFASSVFGSQPRTQPGKSLGTRLFGSVII